MNRTSLVTGLTVLTLAVVLVFAVPPRHAAAQGQQHTQEVWTFNPVMAQVLSDSGLVNKEMHIYQYGVPPGRVDTVAHRHPGELFVYVQAGAIEYAMDGGEPQLFEAGSVLHEPPYSLHTLFRNPSTSEQAKLLLIYVATAGKPLTIREH